MAESLLRSLMVGEKTVGRGFTCQALVCAATSSACLTEFFKHVGSSAKYQSRSALFVAYRFPESEGFEESEDAAASQKLLHLLQRLGVENIIVGVALWTDAAVQSLGVELYRSVLAAARSLLEEVHSGVLRLRKSALEQQKRSFLELPPINADKWQTPRGGRRRLNMSMDTPYTAEPTTHLPDADYDACLNTLKECAARVTVAVVNTLQKHCALAEVSTLLQLLLVLLGKVAKCADPSDLLAGRTLRVALKAFRPVALTPRQLAQAQSLQRRLDSSRMSPLAAAEVSLLTAWTKAALKLCAQPTLQPLRPHDDDPENEYQLSSSMTVREGRFGTPTQFVFDSHRAKQLAMTVKNKVRKKKLGDEKSGLAALAELILIKKQEEEAWGQQVEVDEVRALDLDPDLEGKLLEARTLQMKQEERVSRLIFLHLEDLRVQPERLHNIPDADVYRYIDTMDFRDLPTGMLMAFAAKLKERRTKRRARRRTVAPV